MKALFSSLFLLVCLAVTAQDKTKVQVVEVSCGQCQFGMKANGCDLAVRLDGKTYFIDGTKIDEHGDAHAEDGFCNAVRQAEVIGEVKDGRFVATYFKLLPLKK
jgi:hypothetical protein